MTEHRGSQASKFTQIPIGPVKYDDEGNLIHPIFGTKMVEVEPGVWRDGLAVALDKAMLQSSQRMMQSMLWKMRGDESPWPRKGHDFRLNKDRNQYPEEPCPYCGRYESDDW